MSDPKRIEIIRLAMAAVARRDVSAFVADLVEDCELRPLMSVWPQPYRGHEGIARWFADLSAVWDEFSVEPEDFRALDADTLLVPLLWRGRGKGTKTELEGPAVAVWRFREDKAVSAHLFPDEARAIAAFEAGD